MTICVEQGFNTELKYCERCGTLGLRREGSGRVYCGLCEQAMSEVYLAPHRSRNGELEEKKSAQPWKKPCASVCSAEGEEGVQFTAGGRWL